jgi:hypothetical protein
MQRQYVCAICNETLQGKGEPSGLKTFTCKKHPFRFVTVERDTSGGQENSSTQRKTPVQVKRHTLVKVLRTK